MFNHLTKTILYLLDVKYKGFLLQEIQRIRNKFGMHWKWQRQNGHRQVVSVELFHSIPPFQSKFLRTARSMSYGKNQLVKLISSLVSTEPYQAFMCFTLRAQVGDMALIRMTCRLSKLNQSIWSKNSWKYSILCSINSWDSVKARSSVKVQNK